MRTYVGDDGGDDTSTQRDVATAETGKGATLGACAAEQHKAHCPSVVYGDGGIAGRLQVCVCLRMYLSVWMWGCMWECRRGCACLLCMLLRLRYTHTHTYTNEQLLL